MKQKEILAASFLLLPLIFIIFSPSYQIPIVSFEELETVHKLNGVQPGQIIFVADQKEQQLFLNQRSLSIWPSSKTILKFGVVGVTPSESVVLHGHQVVERPWGLWKQGKIAAFKSVLPLLYSVDRPINQLRIPTSIWKKMNEDVADKKNEQREKMYSILKQNSGNLSPSCWSMPLTNQIINSHFASRRTLPNGHTYLHTGIDLRASAGTPIFASAKGVVKLAEHQIVPGNVVVVDHGGGVYSRYMHLNGFNVRVGETVEMGQVIGTVGATGRVEGPHLHFEVVWKGNHARPLEFVEHAQEFCDVTSA